MWMATFVSACLLSVISQQVRIDTSVGLVDEQESGKQSVFMYVLVKCTSLGLDCCCQCPGFKVAQLESKQPILFPGTWWNTTITFTVHINYSTLRRILFTCSLDPLMPKCYYHVPRFEYESCHISSLEFQNFRKQGHWKDLYTCEFLLEYIWSSLLVFTLRLKWDRGVLSSLAMSVRPVISFCWFRGERLVESNQFWVCVLGVSRGRFLSNIGMFRFSIWQPSFQKSSIGWGVMLALRCYFSFLNIMCYHRWDSSGFIRNSRFLWGNKRNLKKKKKEIDPPESL
jgi:hypothetical protein